MAWQWKQRIARTDTNILEGAKRQLVMKNWINYSINTSINKSIDISIINWTVNSYVHETQVVFKLMYASLWPLFVCPFFFRYRNLRLSSVLFSDRTPFTAGQWWISWADRTYRWKYKKIMRLVYEVWRNSAKFFQKRRRRIKPYFSCFCDNSERQRI